METRLKQYEQGDNYVIPKSLLRHLRIDDKLNRIISNPDSDKMEESPYQDIAGYGLLGTDISEKLK